MKNRSSQTGLGLVFFMVVLALIGAGGLAGWVIGKPYMDAAAVRNLAKEALRQAKMEPTMTEIEIRQGMFNNINIQGFPIKFDDIVLRPVGEGTYELEVDMTREIPLWEDASLLLNLVVVEQTQ